MNSFMLHACIRDQMQAGDPGCIKTTSSEFLHMSDVEKRDLADILHFRTVCVCPFKHDLVTPFYRIM